ncbi:PLASMODESMATA CALLOSE-BINDING PROTEIN 3-like [Mangifera indica]|uniref:PLASMODESMATA CALLOSE-BINDING PROTEIN 3-like n=1 Tax=Mangifera indica TaxID=29780 RepID=UPI001CFAB3B6|nr:PLASMODESMATA CALLOSE-BINDING PROTEIN 3-like [Mangifera indica]
MAPAFSELLLLFTIFCTNVFMPTIIVEAQENISWCVARSDASNQVLQTALDYACGAGADCTPILPNGLCYLPNTIQAHASYAFNSYFQRKSMAPGSCDFSGTATVAKSDPSYGSCVYPSSLSTAGGNPSQGSTPTTTTTNNPNMPTTPAAPLDNNGGNGVNSGFSPPIPTTDNSKASTNFMAITILMPISLWIVLSLTLPNQI